LISTPFTRCQTELSDTVIRLRDQCHLLYWQIAAGLVEEGYRGARAAALDAKGVFSIYKEREARDARPNQRPRFAISRIEVNYEPSG
jgi:hypothetical protein